MAFVGKKGKAYGLIIAKDEKRAQTAPSVAPVRPSVFDDASDEDDAFDERFGKIDMKKAALLSRSKAAPKVDIGKCLEEDPTIFEYDSIYESISVEKQERGIVKVVSDRKPKYIEGLLKTASKRNMDLEYHKERKVQKEREAEGAQFADKEAFVTSAYKKKMEEFKELEKQQKLMEIEDAKNDATKKEDMSSFYKHTLSVQTKKHSVPDTQTDEKDTTSEKTRPTEDSKSMQQRKSNERRRSPHNSRKGRSDHQDARDSSSKVRRSEREVIPNDEGENEIVDYTSEEIVDPHLLVKYRRKNDVSSISEAQERYLARKNKVQPIIEDDSD